MRSVDVGGVRLHVDRSGRGEPMLWLSGFALSAAAWEPVLPLYTGRLDCVGFDARGTGRSSGWSGPVSIPQLAGDAVAVLDALGIDSAHVYGVSYGGMVAQELAIRFPHRVRGLVLGGTTPGGPLAARPTLAELRAVRDGLPGLLYSPEFLRAQPERVTMLRRALRSHPAPPAGVASHFLASVYHDTVARLGRIVAPTLVLHGGADSMIPVSNARMLAERIPDAELAVVPGAGHAYLLEKPEESARLVLDWLDRRSPIRAGARRFDPAEPLTRALGLPVGMARTGRSLVRLGLSRAAAARAAERRTPDQATATRDTTGRG